MRILGLIATLVMLGQPVLAETPPPMISVAGEGRINVAPDMATIMLGVTTEADTAKAAMDANSERLAGAIAALKAAGCKHFVLEHDNPADHKRFATRSAAFVKGL